jgi:hypothetical protein
MSRWPCGWSSWRSRSSVGGITLVIRFEGSSRVTGGAAVRGVAAGPADVDLVACPAAAAFGAVAGVNVYGEMILVLPAGIRIARRPARSPPAQTRAGVLLDPDPAQHVECGDLAQPGRGPLPSDRSQGPVAVPTNLDRELLPVGLLIRQPPLVDTRAVPFDHRSVDMPVSQSGAAAANASNAAQGRLPYEARVRALRCLLS